MHRQVIKITVALLIMVTLACTVVSAHEHNPLNGFKIITAPEVKNLLEQNNAMLIHVLSQLEYEMQHISGSINIPFNEIAETGKLPADKNVPLVFYCMGQK